MFSNPMLFKQFCREFLQEVNRIIERCSAKKNEHIAHSKEILALMWPEARDPNLDMSGETIGDVTPGHHQAPLQGLQEHRFTRQTADKTKEDHKDGKDEDKDDEEDDNDDDNDDKDEEDLLLTRL